MRSSAGEPQFFTFAKLVASTGLGAVVQILRRAQKLTNLARGRLRLAERKAAPLFALEKERRGSDVVARWPLHALRA